MFITIIHHSNIETVSLYYIRVRNITSVDKREDIFKRSFNLLDEVGIYFDFFSSNSKVAFWAYKEKHWHVLNTISFKTVVVGLQNKHFQ